ncbi:hypothetical protein M569_13395 [Genlisea aurea]|uniref:Uncharacterized protein n=1 Tax=Genlisea aurea TaxID=192259 RepID=S8DNY9_9LAMI|nr:hypothetical protein M569_13395 [Genlisea aurea]
MDDQTRVSSIALLQERFRMLERMKELRNEKTAEKKSKSSFGDASLVHGSSDARNHASSSDIDTSLRL